VLATRLGVAAVDALVEGKGNCLVGERGRRIELTSFSDLKGDPERAPLALLEVIDNLA
jgi:6-phosphofructokinase